MHDARGALSSAVLFLLTVLVLAPSLLSFHSGTHASNICVCECCEGAHCTRNNTRAFTIYDTCVSGCTRDFCTENFPQYCDRENDKIDIVANCVNRDTWVNPAVIMFFLLTVTTLVALGIAKNYNPKLKRLIKAGS